MMRLVAFSRTECDSEYTSLLRALCRRSTTAQGAVKAVASRFGAVVGIDRSQLEARLHRSLKNSVSGRAACGAAIVLVRLGFLSKLGAG